MSSNMAQPFAMTGCREVIKAWDGAVQVELLVKEIERAVTENPSLVFDLARALVECICKTILHDRGVTLERNPDLPALFTLALQSMTVIPSSRSESDKTDTALRAAISGLNKIVDGLCRLRNIEGSASHGKDGYMVPLEPLQAQLAARSADTVVHFLYNAHIAYPIDASKARLHYTDRKEFNDYIDGINEVIQIFDYRYQPSEVLFYVDNEAYREELIGYTDREPEDEDE